MSRITSNDSLWPLGILMLEGVQTLEQHERMLNIWDEWFARGERFVSLRLHVDENALDQVPGVAKITKQWLSDGAAENMRRLVSGMVIVTPPSRFDSLRHLSVEKVFGVPGGIFASLDDALEWLANRDQLTAKAMATARDIVESFQSTRS